MSTDLVIRCELGFAVLLDAEHGLADLWLTPTRVENLDGVGRRLG
jgi:hypothetical protein